MKIEEIIERNYKATVKRGQINKFTTAADIVEKLFEEVYELDYSTKIDNYFDEKELADVVLVCFTMAKHFDINLIEAMKEKMLFNEQRKD